MSSVRTNSLKNSSESVTNLMKMRKGFIVAQTGSPTLSNLSLAYFYPEYFILGTHINGNVSAVKVLQPVKLHIYNKINGGFDLTLRKKAKTENVFGYIDLQDNQIYEQNLNEGDEIFFSNGAIYDAYIVFQIEPLE